MPKGAFDGAPQTKGGGSSKGGGFPGMGAPKGKAAEFKGGGGYGGGGGLGGGCGMLGGNPNAWSYGQGTKMAAADQLVQGTIKGGQGQGVPPPGKGFGGKGSASSGQGKGLAHSNLFVGSLPEGTTANDLKDAFGSFGKLKSHCVKTKGAQTYGFVEFMKVGDAERAVAAMNGHLGWLVKFSDNDAGPNSWEDMAPHSNVYVGNLAPGTPESILKQTCMVYGTVDSCMVKSDADSGKCFGFVKFSTHAAASRAITELSEQRPDWNVKFANRDARDGAAFWPGMFGGKGLGPMPPWPGPGGPGGPGGGWGWYPPQNAPREDRRPEGPPSQNLYIKDLPPAVSEEQVTALVSKHGRITECRVLWRDGWSAGAALVSMATLEEAARAKEQLDGSIHDSCNKRLSVKLQMKNGASVPDHLHVKGFHFMTTDSQLSSLFSKYGTVKWCKILGPVVSANSWSIPDCAGLVQMASPEEAQSAIAALHENFSEGLGMPIKVSFAEERPERASPTPNNNLFVKGWPVGFPDFLLSSFFQQYGTVVRLRLLDNPDLEQPTCAALVQMSSIAEANQALAGLNGRTIKPNLPPIRVKYSGPGQVASDNLYVSALPRTMTQEKIHDIFSKYGKIERVRVLVQPGKPETHALVQMGSQEAAAAALKGLNGHPPPFDGIVLSVAFAMKREGGKR